MRSDSASGYVGQAMVATQMLAAIRASETLRAIMLFRQLAEANVLEGQLARIGRLPTNGEN